MHSHPALLLTDVVNSTRLSQAVGDAEIARLWTAHDRAARDLLPAWHGREIDKSDGLFLLFPTAADAAGYALAYHRQLAVLGLPFQARAGLHVGPVTLRENRADDVAQGAKPLEVDGLAKPIVARVMSAAMGGQTLLTADARAALGPSTLRLQSHGHWRLQGVQDPIELFEVGDAASPFQPPPDAAKAYRVLRRGELWLPVREMRHSLPAERDSFVGRHEALRTLAGKLAEDARLVSVLGIGGTGKTRLVTRFAWTWLGDYPGGVWFCDLSQARGLDGVVFAVAQGLDVPLGRSDPVQQLAHALAGRGDCLVILDNFEQVARHAEATLGQWLDRAPRARFIVTTREVLGIAGEQVLALAPLPLADAAHLFRQRAESARQDYRPGADDVAAIEQLVTVLDGLPLAIELAAARIRVMPPRALLARMHERFKVLWSRAGRQDRQATLRGAFDWSWELLGEAERSALAQLSVFRGGFTLEAAEAVLDLAATGNTPWPPDIVLSLVEKSFVRQVDDARFDLLESVREYAAEHLASPGHFAGSGPGAALAVEQRHQRFFASLGPQRATEARCVELDNLVAACRGAVARQDTETAAAALVGAWGAIRLRGPFRVGLALAEAVQAMGSLAALTACEVELVRGLALELCGRAPEARLAFERLVDQAGTLGARRVEVRARHRLAVLLALQGQAPAAVACGERALALASTLDDPGMACGVHNSLGELCEAQGRLDEARRHYETALQLARDAGDQRWEGGSAGNLGQFHANRGHLALARPLYERAVQIAVALGDRQWEANTRCNLGLLHHSEQRYGEARVELQAVLVTAQDLGYLRLQAIVHCNLGLVEEATGQADQARQCHEAALALARQVGDRRSEGQFLGYLGALQARTGRFDAARSDLQAGEDLLRAAADRLSLGILLCARAEAEHLAGQPAAGERAWAEAQALAAELGPVEPAAEFGIALRRTARLYGMTLAA